MSTILHPFKIVLDYDGVVFRNPYAMERVSDRSAQYVGKKLRVSHADARLMNTTRYKMHGHTVRYLNDLGVDATIEEYNSFVFENIDWDDIGMNIREADYEQLADVYFINEEMHQKCVLFSNAPRMWIDRTLACVGTDAESLFETVFTCESLEQLKPNPVVYDAIEDYFPDADLLFLDDNLVNVHELGPRWKPHWFKPHDNMYRRCREMVDEYID